MDLDHIRLALAVARAGSLSQAAILLNVNQSTVSRRLDALESTLDTRLFLRSKQGMIPTDIGEMFISGAAKIEAQAESLSDAVHMAGNGPSGVVRLLGTPWVIDWVVRTSLSDFRRRYPDISLRTVAGQSKNNLWRCEPGVGVWFESSSVDGALSRKLGTISYAVYIASGPQPPTNWVCVHDEARPDNLTTLHVKRALTGDERIVFTAMDENTLHEAIAAGAGRGLLPVALGEDDPRIVRARPSEVALQRPLYVHVQPHIVRNPRVKVLMTWLRQALNPIVTKDQTLVLKAPRHRTKQMSTNQI